MRGKREEREEKRSYGLKGFVFVCRHLSSYVLEQVVIDTRKTSSSFCFFFSFAFFLLSNTAASLHRLVVIVVVAVDVR